MKRYKFFALDQTGRVDRGFEKHLLDLDAAIAHAMTIEGAAKIEILDEGRVIARVVFSSGGAKVLQ